MPSRERRTGEENKTFGKNAAAFFSCSWAAQWSLGCFHSRVDSSKGGASFSPWGGLWGAEGPHATPARGPRRQTACSLHAQGDHILPISPPPPPHTLCHPHSWLLSCSSNKHGGLCLSTLIPLLSQVMHPGLWLEIPMRVMTSKLTCLVLGNSLVHPAAHLASPLGCLLAS